MFEEEIRLPTGLALVPARHVVVTGPTIRICLAPGDRVLVSAGEAVLPGTPLVERTPDAGLIDVGSLDETDDGLEAGGESGADGTMAISPAEAAGREPAGREADEAGPAAGASSATGGPAAAGAPPAPHGERRGPPFPGKSWIGGEQRRGRLGPRYLSRRVGGTLLFEVGGHWQAAAGERHELVEAPVAGIVRRARNGVDLILTISGSGVPAALAAGEIARGYLDVPPEGDLSPRVLDVGRAGAIVVAGSRVDAETLTRARAMGIRGIVAASVASNDLRDLAASEARQRASLHAQLPFGVLGLDGSIRRAIAGPVAALLRTLRGHEVAIVGDPPMLLFDAPELSLPEFPPDWVRVRGGALAGREGRWVAPAGLRRFGAGVHLEAAFVRIDDEQTVVPVSDLERFIF